jgi:diguanylate cyclase (GGDEF)-like protein/PAS domain S-box-containing protein
MRCGCPAKLSKQMPLIDLFPWHASLATGIAEIDQLRRQFVAHLNRLAEELASTATADTLQPLFDQLAECAAKHFAAEALLWQRPAAEASAERACDAAHQALHAMLAELKQSLGLIPAEQLASETLQQLARWLASYLAQTINYDPADAASPTSKAPETDRAQLLEALCDLQACHVRNTARLLRQLQVPQPAGTALERQRAYREFILRLAVSFINLPLDRLDTAIQDALANMSQFFVADRAYVFSYDFKAQISINTHEWCAAGIEPMISELQALPLWLSPDWVDAHLKGEPLIIAAVSEMPAGPVRQLLQAQNVASLLTMPLMDGSECLGFVGFDSLQEWRQFGQDELDVLALFANLLVSISQRNAISKKLEENTEALALAHRRLLNILDGTNAAVYVADMQTHELLFLNQLAQDFSQGNALGKPCWKVIQGKTDGPCDFCTNPRLLNADGKPAESVSWVHFNPVSKRWYQLHDQAIPWDDGRYVRLEIALDITEQKTLQQSLSDSEERYRLLFEQSRDALVILSPHDWHFIAANQAMYDLLGVHDLEELQSIPPAELAPPTQPDGNPSVKRAQQLLQIALRDGSWFGEWIYRHRDGHDIPSTLLLTRSKIGGQTMIQGTVRDITLQKSQQRQLERLAHYDPLTALPNRVLLAERMQQAMAEARSNASVLAIAYLDLDGFKTINDRHGHDAGDRLLVAAANRMSEALRSSDTLARLGGDEFVAVLGDLPNREACLPMLDRLLAAAAAEETDHGFALQVSASIGVTFYPQPQAMDADQLLRQADQAMYQAKLAGKNHYHLFDLLNEQTQRGHHENLAHLEQALRAQEFVLHYQPKVNMRTGEVVGLEALLRWQHPQRGLLAPAEFLLLIEGHALEIDLDNWVLETALAQISAWHQQGLYLPVSVNLSAQQLQHADFLPKLAELLRKYPDCSPGQLELEILESSALQDLDRVTHLISACRALGVGFALDDFGTGYSSLLYLKRLPIQTIKIDRSFVHDMLTAPQGLAILEGVLGLARAFRLRPIAEGVEQLAQGEALLDLGCELAQGYGISPALPSADVADWIAGWRTPDAWSSRHTTIHPF